MQQNQRSRGPVAKKRPAPKPGEPCPLHRKCGGCQLQNMTYERQLQWKQTKTEQLLSRFHRVAPILGMKYPYYYRNKVQAAFGTDVANRIISGVYQSSTNRIVPVDHCLTEDQKSDAIIVTIRKLMPKMKMLPYDEHRKQGFLRHVLVKRGFQSGQIMVVLVTTSPIFATKKHFLTALLKEHPEITTVLLNVNERHTSMLLGEKEKILYGPGKIEETLCGCTFRISAKSFYQINPTQTQVLYEKAMELAGLTGKETVIDAYCGVGTIGIIAARSAKQVLGIELNRDAVRDAIGNAKLNHLSNIYFRCADAGEYLSDMAQEVECVDVVFMDPPRAGSDERFLATLCKLMPKRIVYISCNPETQARDLQYLCKNGYKASEIQPVDMFPHTNHVETVVLLSHKNS